MHAISRWQWVISEMNEHSDKSGRFENVESEGGIRWLFVKILNRWPIDSSQRTEKRVLGVSDCCQWVKKHVLDASDSCQWVEKRVLDTSDSCQWTKKRVLHASDSCQRVTPLYY